MPNSLRDTAQRRLVGDDGQRRIGAARVVVVGVGGLGCPVAQYLAGASVGALVLVDPDTVSESNLPRQTLFTPQDLGLAKAEVAARLLRQQNPSVQIDAVPVACTPSNVRALIAGADVVVDACDDPATKVLLSDSTGVTPLVFGAVSRHEGRVAVFNGAADAPCYRCLYPSGAELRAEACSEVGVLGPLCGVIGSLQAYQTLQLIAFGEAPLTGALAVFDAETLALRRLRIPKRPECVCARRRRALPLL